MSPRISTILALCLVTTCSACSTWRKLNNTEKGAVIGTGTGAAVGSTVAPGPGGAVVGGAIGGVGGGLIGHEMDQDERRNRN